MTNRVLLKIMSSENACFYLLKNYIRYTKNVRRKNKIWGCTSWSIGPHIQSGRAVQIPKNFKNFSNSQNFVLILYCAMHFIYNEIHVLLYFFVSIICVHINSCTLQLFFSTRVFFWVTKAYNIIHIHIYVLFCIHLNVIFNLICNMTKNKIFMNLLFKACIIVKFSLLLYKL